MSLLWPTTPVKELTVGRPYIEHRSVDYGAYKDTNEF
jgi:hypothetical protein